MEQQAAEPGIRATPESVDAPWLTAVLRRSGHDCEIDGVTRAGVGTGQVGQNVRFQLSYARGEGPASVVGKFASDDPESRQTGIALSNYLREVRFYQELRASLAIQTPTVLYTDIDETTHDFVLLMEDLAPGEQGDQLAGCDEAAALLALEELAGLHGPRWGDEALLDVEWLGRPSPESESMVEALWRSGLPGFLERYAAQLSGEDVETCRGLDAVFSNYGAPRATPLTVTHGDYRLDNMLFGGPYPVAVVDWQSPGLGCGPADAAYFMGTGMDPAPRAACEDRLLRRYHERLLGFGVQDYDFDACWADYRRSAFAGLVMAVIASMIVGQTERGDAMFMAMARRSAAMGRDLDSLALLG